jgi:hypothetical protein
MPQDPKEYIDRLRLLRRHLVNVVQIDDLYLMAKGSSIEDLRETRNNMFRTARVMLLGELEHMKGSESDFEELKAMKERLIDHSPFSKKNKP